MKKGYIEKEKDINGVKVLSITGPFTKETTPILQEICNKVSSEKTIKAVLLDFSTVTDVDTSAFACMVEFIEKHIDKPWNWYMISKNPNITIEFIEKNIDKIYFRYLSQNKFGWKKDDTLLYYKQRKWQTLENTKKIKEDLMIATMNPDRKDWMEWVFDIDEVKEMKCELS